MNPFPTYKENGELDTRLRVDPVTGDVGIGTPKGAHHMTKDEIIEMACQAFGGVIKKEERDNFIAFAKLVAEHEREACASLAEEYANGLERNYSEIIAENIRARGKE